MSFKDKPKREGGKTFDRDRKKPAAARKPDEGAFSPSERSGKPARKPAFDAGSAAGADKPERISKILARAGIASRRDVERMIMEGRVSVNGKVLESPVLNATMSDKIEVDGQPIRGIERTRLWLYHKPAGLVTTNSDPEGRPTVFDSLPEELPRVMSIGRLDINTEGLLLLTNDGGLSRVLELPTTGWLRRYRVRAYGEVSQEQLDKLKDGVAVDGVLYGAIDATLDRTQGHNVWITMGLREGKNREIKNVMGALGLEVNRLIRISYGPFQLGDLPEGHVVEARGRMLRDQLGPRLIEEAKANFDAPIYNNPPPEEDDKPEVRSPRAEKAWGAGEKNAGPRTERDAPRGERREGGKFGERSNDRPQGRGDGKFAGKGKPAGKFERKFEGQGGGRFDEEQPKKRPPMGTSRTANVWMAPGARPTKDGAGKPSARAEAERLFTKPTEAPRRPNVNRVQGDSDWIRGEEAPAAPARGGRDDARGARGAGPRGRDDQGDRGERSDRGPRPDRGDRPFRSERPDRGDRPARGDRPPREERSEGRERSFSDRPRGKPSFSKGPGADRPPREGGERSFGRPQGDRTEGRGRPSGGRPSGDRSFGDRPSGDRAERGDREGGRGGFGGRPGGKSFGGKPSGDRAFGERSGGERSGGERASGERAGGKSFGGKPAGKSFGKPAGGFGGKPGGAGKPGGRPAGGSGKPGGRPSGGRPAGNRGPGSGSGPRSGGGNKGPRGPRG